MRYPPVLCINLAGATVRWESIQQQVPQALPGATLKRMDAVNWRNLPKDLPLTLFSRYLLRFPGKQGPGRPCAVPMSPWGVSCTACRIARWTRCPAWRFC
jgi:hypothetical protein